MSCELLLTIVRNFQIAVELARSVLTDVLEINIPVPLLRIENEVDHGLSLRRRDGRLSRRI